jgi:hypothetical protein
VNEKITASKSLIGVGSFLVVDQYCLIVELFSQLEGTFDHEQFGGQSPASLFSETWLACAEHPASKFCPDSA